jgi:pimeloyl-ACP methyl ester carboxylesterase
VTAETLRTQDGLLLAATWSPAGATPLAAAVIAHGFAGSKDDQGLRRIADALVSSGVSVLAYDSRGHSGSQGECTLGELEGLDVDAAVRACRERAERVVVVGASMGAISGLRYAATDPGISGVVAVSCPATWRRPRNLYTVLMTGITRTRVGRRFAARRFGVRISSVWSGLDAPAVLAGKLATRLAVVHGTRDRYVPVADARQLRAAAGAQARLDIVDGMGHGFDELAAPAVLAAVGWTVQGRVRSR